MLHYFPDGELLSLFILFSIKYCVVSLNEYFNLCITSATVVLIKNVH